MALRMAAVLTSTSSLSEWVSLAQNVPAVPPRDQVLDVGTESVGGHPICLIDLKWCGI